MTETAAQSVRLRRSSAHCGRTLTEMLLEHQPQLASQLEGLFEVAPHRFSILVRGAALRLDSLRRLINELDIDILPPSIRQSVPKRRLSFIGGRLCAEHSLERLGLQGAAVNRGPSGEPMWPGGTVGSITHTDEMVYATVCERNGPFGIGIDTEKVVNDSALQDIRLVCCTDRENDLLSFAVSPLLTGTLFFSAKESLFKAIHSSVRRIVDFCEVEVVSIDWLQQELHLRPVSDGDLVDQIPECKALFRVDTELVHTSVAFDVDRPKKA